MRRLVLALAAAAALAACGAPRAERGAGAAPGGAAEALARFCRALEDGRYDEAHRLLSARWRAAYTPGQLAQDRAGARAVADAATAEILAALAAGAPVVAGDGRAVLPTGPGRAAVAVLEEGGWRVDALE